MTSPIQLDATSDGVVITVWVVPGAARDQVVGAHGDALKVRVAAPPEGGQANRSVERLLRGAFQCRAAVVAGAQRRRKRVLLAGANRSAIESGLSDLLTGSGDC